ncbi:MAG: DUF4114 domain-containing protein [Verrucomicrobiota bacterium]
MKVRESVFIDSAFASLTGLLGFAISTTLILSQSTSAQEVLKKQAVARPFNLDIVGPVYERATDTRSSDFANNVLPEIDSMLSQKLSERSSIENISALSVDPSKLKLTTEANARVYFVGEGAGYHNTLGFQTFDTTAAMNNASTITEGAQIVFPDASSKLGVVTDSGLKNTRRSWNEPLLPGDFVDLGNFASGTLLDFFLVANGARGGRNTYVFGSERNPDGLEHMVGFALPGSPYLVLGFEDLFNGGDRDYNDLLFAVDIGELNVKTLVSAPEPELWLLLAGFLVFIYYRTHRAKKA